MHGRRNLNGTADVITIHGKGYTKGTVSVIKKGPLYIKERKRFKNTKKESTEAVDNKPEEQHLLKKNEHGKRYTDQPFLFPRPVRETLYQKVSFFLHLIV
ncbi:hypothetical protein MUN46_011295 [Mesosutterella sp. AGMB02718]|uniref:Uncharacterized protein n=1 Tax=Mesosutterella faecium TaxID=2925194 RepID=A0ABT7IQ56_9BURK|nr:hypothetical protein [Mesosutterella sp. AGMB02718]MDL2060521.1 hypothetical protein [Mesosutterella sp. AGMB02718]